MKIQLNLEQFNAISLTETCLELHHNLMQLNSNHLPRQSVSEAKTLIFSQKQTLKSNRNTERSIATIQNNTIMKIQFKTNAVT